MHRFRWHIFANWYYIKLDQFVDGSEIFYCIYKYDLYSMLLNEIKVM